MRLLALLLCLFVAAKAGPVSNPDSPYYTDLDAYVAKPDSNYRYEIWNATIKGKYWKGTILKMYSQQWLTPNDWNFGNPNTSNAIWWHWMTIVVPEMLDPAKLDTGLIYIADGHNTDGPPTDPETEDNGLLATLCLDMGIVGASLYDIPNQPLYFPADPSKEGRSEDALVGYTWSHYLQQSNDSEWFVLLPMTKATVRAMDTLADFVKGTQKLTKFLLSGASKRGWTTWTSALVDDRVVAIAPIVFDLLNQHTSLHHMWRAYGGWTFAFADYYAQNLTRMLDSPNFAKYQTWGDPFSYIADPIRLKMPKLVINAAMDEFFQGDNDQFWWNNMPEPKFRQMCENAEHSEITGIPEIVGNIAAWANAYFQKKPFPNFTWTIDPNDGSITVRNDGSIARPINVSMWYAPNFHRVNNIPGLRDWRIAGGYDPTLPQVYLWRQEELNETAPNSNTWIARQPMPHVGWMAFFVEVFYEGPHPYWNATKVSHYRLTTQISIIPKMKWPFEDCYDQSCYGTLV